MAAFLVAEALGGLLLFDLLSICGFSLVHAFTRGRRVARTTPTPEVTARVCRAVEEACIWYVKRAYCLQRSSVTTWMLRRRGVAAELVIGYRPVPVDSHAWVEVDGQVVNDRPQYQKFFRVLVECSALASAETTVALPTFRRSRPPSPLGSMSSDR